MNQILYKFQNKKEIITKICIFFFNFIVNVSVDLTAAVVEIFYSIHPSAAVMDQAVSRIYRFKQTNPCLIIMLMTNDETEKDIFGREQERLSAMHWVHWAVKFNKPKSKVFYSVSLWLTKKGNFFRNEIHFIQVVMYLPGLHSKDQRLVLDMFLWTGKIKKSIIWRVWNIVIIGDFLKPFL